MKYLDPIPHFYRKQPFWGPILTGRFADEYRFNTSVLPHKLPLSVKVDYVARKIVPDTTHDMSGETLNRVLTRPSAHHRTITIKTNADKKTFQMSSLNN